MLKDGKYKMFYDGQTENVGKFEIDGNIYYSYEGLQKKEYKIKMIGKCSFEINTDEVIDDSKLTKLQKALKNQKAYFEIVNVEDEVYYFICRVDLHINCGKGKFIRDEIIKSSPK